MSWFQTISKRHERLKEFIHNGLRYPLPKYGQNIMGFVYFCIPVISGWYVMQWAISKSHQSIGLYGEKLPNKSLQGVGDQRPVFTTVPNGEQGSPGGTTPNSDTKTVVTYEKVGAGGWGGGVHLVVSDEEEQKRNRKKLRKLLKKLQPEETAESTASKKVRQEKREEQ